MIAKLFENEFGMELSFRLLNSEIGNDRISELMKTRCSGVFVSLTRR